jgi:glyoxalase family protein
MTISQGIHHVTAITGALDRHLDFYTRILGLRLVKRTVNFDDPASHHLYYGDATGRPGSIMTFFVWPGGRAGRVGTGVAGAVAFAVPATSIGFWYERLLSQGARLEAPARRFGEPVLEFPDPDGMRVELVGVAGLESAPAWDGGPVPAEHAVRGLHGVTIWENGDDGHAATLERVFGFRPDGEEENRVRFRGTGEMGAVVDLRRVGGFWTGTTGTDGTVIAPNTRLRDAEDWWKFAFVVTAFLQVAVMSRCVVRCAIWWHAGGRTSTSR